MMTAIDDDTVSAEIELRIEGKHSATGYFELLFRPGSDGCRWQALRLTPPNAIGEFARPNHDWGDETPEFTARKRALETIEKELIRRNFPIDPLYGSMEAE